MEEGDLFGEMPLFDGQPRTAEARSLEPTEMVVVPYHVVRDVLESARRCCGASSSCSRTACVRPTRHWPTRCSST